MHVVGDLDWAGGAKVGKHHAKDGKFAQRCARVPPASTST